MILFGNRALPHICHPFQSSFCCFRSLGELITHIPGSIYQIRNPMNSLLQREPSPAKRAWWWHILRWWDVFWWHVFMGMLITEDLTVFGSTHGPLWSPYEPLNPWSPQVSETKEWLPSCEECLCANGVDSWPGLHGLHFKQPEGWKRNGVRLPHQTSGKGPPSNQKYPKNL